MFDIPIWSVILIVWALIESWPPVVLMWVCWGQGICFGLFILLRVLFIRRSGAWDNYRRARLAPKTFGVFIFQLFFYLFYIFFLLKLFEKLAFDYGYIRMILFPIGLYFLSQLFCLVYRMVKGEIAIINQNFFNRTLFSGLAPMHIMIIGAGFLKTVIESKMYGTGALLFLLVLKLLADTGTFVYSIKGFNKNDLRCKSGV